MISEQSRCYNIDFTTIHAVNYSTQEQATGGKWIDGKPIYVKTVDCGDLLNAGEKMIPHGLNIGHLVDVSAMGARKSSNTYLPIPYVADPRGSNLLPTGMGINITQNEIVILTGSDRTALRAYVTLWYTKA